MAGTKKKLQEPSSKRRKQQFVTSASDFCDFGSLETQERCSASEDESIDSDIEDAIYARMYFDESNAAHPQHLKDIIGAQESAISPPPDEKPPLELFSVSLDVSPSIKNEESCDMRGKEKAGAKRKRKSGRKTHGSSAKRAHTTDTADTGVIVIDSDGSSDVIIIDSYSAECAESEDISTSTRPSKSKAKKSGESSPESDIHLLFSEDQPAKPVSAGVTEVRGSSSSMESGELAGSRETSRLPSSDMDLCSGEAEAEDINEEGSNSVAELWAINEKDKLGREAYERLHGEEDSAGRYYGGKRGMKCTNCKQKGHAGRNCPWPKRHNVCYLCSELNHMSSSCPEAICTYCLQKKHRGMPCRGQWAGPRTVCERCYMRGHHASVCPDIWRQYHHTTYACTRPVMLAGVLQRRQDKIYCSNCSAKGHFGFECSRSLPRGNPSYHLPLISVYDNNLWPPRDAQSQRIVQKALATPRKTAEEVPKGSQAWIFMEAPGKVLADQRSDKFSTPQSSSGGSRDLEFSGGSHESHAVRTDRKRKVSEAQKMKEKKREKGEKRLSKSTKNNMRKKKKKAERRAAEELERADGEEATLLVTVDGHGSKTIVSPNHPSPFYHQQQQQQRRSNLHITPSSSSLAHRPTSLLQTPLSPPNHMHPGGAKRPLLMAPHSGSSRGDFPREPLPQHYYPAQHYDHRSPPGEFYSPNTPPVWDRLDASTPSSQYHRHQGRGSREEWYSDGFDHTPSPSLVDPAGESRYTRSYSFSDSRSPPLPPRRFSEHLEPKSRHSRTHPQGATPSYAGGGHMRGGEVLSSSRGFQMSEQRARQTGHYCSPRDRSPHYNRTSYSRRY